MISRVQPKEHSPFDCVVDANVGIKLFLMEPLSEQAYTLFAHLSDELPAQLYVPDLFFIECANILWKYARRFGYPAADALQDIGALAQLPLQRVAMAALVEAALELALRYSSTAYDSAYVALAQRLGLPLITADEALVRRFAGSGLDVRFLGGL